MSALTDTTGVIDSSFTPVYKRVIGWVAAQMAVATLTALTSAGQDVQDLIA